MNAIVYLFYATIILILSVNRCKANTMPLAVPPAGKYISPNAAEFDEAESFSSLNRIVRAYYFYWYDVYSKAHIIRMGSKTLSPFLS